jgi:flagellar basal-body rod protein FlgB
MSSGMFGDVSTSAIYEAMQGLWDEQQSVANNVANIDTPNFKAKDVNFATRRATTSTSAAKWSRAKRRECSSRRWSTP